MELNIEQSEYVGSFTEEAGIRVAISNSGEMPFPLEQGLSVSPGFATSIGLRKVRMLKKYWPTKAFSRFKPVLFQERGNISHKLHKVQVVNRCIQSFLTSRCQYTGKTLLKTEAASAILIWGLEISIAKHSMHPTRQW